MPGKVVPIDPKARPNPPPATDLWFAQLDVRLGRIEFMVSRLEWQLVMIACGTLGLFLVEIVQALRGM